MGRVDKRWGGDRVGPGEDWIQSKDNGRPLRG